MSESSDLSMQMKVLEEQGQADLLPEVKKELADLEEAPEKRALRVTELMDEIDVSDSNSIIFFGAKAQERLTGISDDMLEGVRSKETGAAGTALNDMVAVLRGLDADELDPRNQGFFSRLFGRTKPIVKFIQQYEMVRNQIDRVSNDLERHKTQMLTDITSLDRLYRANLDYFHTLELYIEAGESKLRQIDGETIPELEKVVQQQESVVKAQELRDLRSTRDDLERRVYDLKLTRQVTMQSLPSIRLVQENDKGLVNKINSTMVNTIPLWRQQLAQAITIYRSSESAKTIKAASDLTNELLDANAQNLKDANAQVRKEIERGVFDIETVKNANQTLIATIQESLQIAEEGRRRRQAASQQLEHCEQELRETLAAASARADGKKKTE